jgi:hypothetical protein
MTTSESIEQFCSYFEGQVLAIGRVTLAPSPENSGAGSEFVYRKVLYVTALDTLAGLRFHRNAFPQLARHNRERFTRFIKEHASWNVCEYVSLPFLKERLEDIKLSDRPLHRHVSTKLAGFSTNDGGSVSVSSMDESVSELLSHATTEKEEEAIYEYQHLSLLYRYRNSLVHESNQPGSGMEVFAAYGEPYYHGYLDDTKWYLVYPVGMFQCLLERSILSFQTYLVDNSVDPYSLVEDKSRW